MDKQQIEQIKAKTNNVLKYVCFAQLGVLLVITIVKVVLGLPLIDYFSDICSFVGIVIIFIAVELIEFAKQRIATPDAPSNFADRQYTLLYWLSIYTQCIFLYLPYSAKSTLDTSLIVSIVAVALQVIGTIIVLSAKKLVGSNMNEKYSSRKKSVIISLLLGTMNGFMSGYDKLYNGEVWDIKNGVTSIAKWSVAWVVIMFVLFSVIVHFSTKIDNKTEPKRSERGWRK